MRIRHLHPWDVSPAEARAIQAELAGRLPGLGSGLWRA